MLPDTTLPSDITFTGLLSPVISELSKVALSLINLPSTGTFSPFFTTIISPTFSSLECTFLISFPTFKFANSSLISIAFSIFSVDLSTAKSCKNSPTLYSNITIAPSKYSPIAIAPIVATVIRKFSSSDLYLNTFFIPFNTIL